MKGLGRNLKYWFTYLGKTFLIVYAMIAGIVAATTFFDGAPTIIDFFENMAAYSVMVSIILVMVYAFTNMAAIFPMTVSLGTRRKTSILAMTLVEHAVILISIVLALIFLTLASKDYIVLAIKYWPLVVGTFFFLMTMGNFVAVLSAKFGRVLGMILYIASVIACSIGATMLFLRTEEVLGFFGGFNMGLMLAFMALAFVLDVLMTVLLNASVRKIELKFA